MFELLLGVALTMLAVLVIYQIFALAELRTRNTIAASDAEQAGLFAVLGLAVEIGNAGNAIAASARELAMCPATGDFVTSLRPVPVLITDGGSPDEPDGIDLWYGTSRTIVTPAPLARPAAAGARTMELRSPVGFAADDVIVAIAHDGFCAIARLEAVSVPDAEGTVSVTLDRSIPRAFAMTDLPAVRTGVLNLGPLRTLSKARYDVRDRALRTAPLHDPRTGDPDPTQVPTPLASNIVNLKLQYGIDSDGDQVVDTWVQATPPWDPAALLGADPAVIARIKAIRIGVIVRSDQYDRTAPAYTWTLFDCDRGPAVSCPGRLTGSLPAGYRYRVFEHVVPLRNAIWNRQ